MPDDSIPEIPAENTQNITQVEGEPVSKRGGKRSTSWAPGKSGNPHGRPRKGQSFHDLVERVGRERVEVPANEGSKKARRVSRKEQLVRTLFREAIAGNIAAARELITRLDGLPKREIDLNVAEQAQGENGQSDRRKWMRALLEAVRDDPTKRDVLLKLQSEHFRVEGELSNLAQDLGINDANGEK